MNAVRIALVSGFIKLSAGAFACGHSGVIRLCTGPFSSMNNRISALENGGPLSLLITCGIPCVANIFSSCGIVAFADVD